MQFRHFFMKAPLRFRREGAGHHGIVGVIDHKAGLGPCHLLHLLFLHVIHLHLFRRRGPWNTRPPGRPASSKSRSGSSSLGRPLRLYDHVGARYPLGVEPQVVSRGEAEGELIVLEVVFPHIDVKAVRGQIVEGDAGDPPFFFALRPLADKAGIPGAPP